MLDKNDLEVLLDIVDNHYFDNKKLTISTFQILLELQKKLQTMIKEMEGNKNGNN